MADKWTLTDWQSTTSTFAADKRELLENCSQWAHPRFLPLEPKPWEALDCGGMPPLFLHAGTVPGRLNDFPMQSKRSLASAVHGAFGAAQGG